VFYENELVIYGMNAIQALVAQRPEAIKRLFFSAEVAPRFGKICKELAANHKTYRKVEVEELDRICKSPHHGGVAANVEKPAVVDLLPGQLPLSLQGGTARLVPVLDQVSNGHNVGAIARSAAFIGVQTLVGDPSAIDAALTSSAYRISEGGLEYLKLHQATKLADWLLSVREKALVVGTDQKATTDLWGFARSAAATGKPVLLVLGNEEDGLSPDVRAVCHETVCVQGNGTVESLNVAQASSIFLWTLNGVLKG